MKDNLWMPEWMRDPNVWEMSDDTTWNVCHMKTPRADGSWRGIRNPSCNEVQWTIRVEHRGRYYAEYYSSADTLGYWPPEKLCDNHYQEYIVITTPYPEIEALHELQEVLRGE